MIELIAKENALQVSGMLNLYNVMALYEQSLSYFESYPLIIIDFSTLQSSDSAGLAIAIEWIKLANKKHKQLSLINFPQKLATMAQAANLIPLIEKYLK